MCGWLLSQYSSLVSLLAPRLSTMLRNNSIVVFLPKIIIIINKLKKQDAMHYTMHSIMGNALYNHYKVQMLWDLHHSAKFLTCNYTNQMLQSPSL